MVFSGHPNESLRNSYKHDGNSPFGAPAAKRMRFQSSSDLKDHIPNYHPSETESLVVAMRIERHRCFKAGNGDDRSLDDRLASNCSSGPRQSSAGIRSPDEGLSRCENSQGIQIKEISPLRRPRTPN
jgi:hypothetical protein